MNTSIRVAEERDAEAACNVLRRSITECCSEDHKDDPALLGPWLENKTPENVRAWITSPGNYAIVAEAHGKIVGVAMMLDSGEITLCYLLPEARFKGVGRMLLADLESRANQLGLGEVRLQSTRTARRFYERNGFRSCGTAGSSLGVSCAPMVKRYPARKLRAR